MWKGWQSLWYLRSRFVIFKHNKMTAEGYYPNTLHCINLPLVCLPIRKLEIILLFFSWKLYLSCYMYTLKLIANWWACELVPKSGTTGSALAGTAPLSSLTQALPLWKDNSGKVITRLIHCNYPVKGATYGSEGYPTGCIHWYFPAGFGACFFCLKLAASWALLMHFIHAQWLHVQLVIIENN